MADLVYNAVGGGSGMYKRSRTKFAASYYKKDEIKDLYPAGGFNVCGQIGAGRTETGVCMSGDVGETVYAVTRMPHTVIKGYICVGEKDYIAVVKDVLGIWIFCILLALLAVAGLGFLIHKVVPASAEPQPSTNPLGVVDSDAQLGEGEWSVPDKIDTTGKNIKINGIAEMRLKAGVREQNWVFSNPKENPCYFKYEIVIIETGETIYTSNLVPPGYSISKFTLNRALDAGTYKTVIHVKTYTFDKQQRPLNNFDMKTNIVVSE